MKKPEKSKLSEYFLSVTGYDFECFHLSEVIEDDKNFFSDNDIKEIFQIGYEVFKYKKGIIDGSNS